MRVELNTKGFEKTEAMDAYLTEVTGDIVDSFLKNDRDVHLRVTVDEDSHRNQARKPHFFCEVVLKTASSKKVYKTLKSADDFRTAVHDAVKALKTILQKRSDRRFQSKLHTKLIPREMDETPESTDHPAA